MIEEAELLKTGALCRRAVLRHQMSERETVMAMTLIRMTFEASAPYLYLEQAIDLARITGFSKGTSKGIIDKLERGRALEVSRDRRIYTVVPPSQAWPWLYTPRVDPRASDESELGALWASQGYLAGDGYLFSPTEDRQFADAIQVERIRRSLLEHHREAAGRLGNHFPVMDHLPKPAPGQTGLSSGEGRAWPPESEGGAINTTPSQSSESSPPRRDRSAGDGPPPVLDLRTRGSQIENPPLRSFKDSESCTAFKTLKLLESEFSNREPQPLAAPEPGASEDQLIAWLVAVLGREVMEKWGGDWRLSIRKSRWSALNTFQQLRLRLTDRHLKPLRNPGGWARDQFNRIYREELDAQPTK